jgi:1,2-diacylglycerol 3-alpha-glucosyltransferase
MRIVIASQTYDPAVNGQGVFTIHLAEGLAQAGYQVMVLTPSERLLPYRTSRRGVLVQAITAIPLGSPKTDLQVTPLPIIQVGRLLDEFEPDIVHIQDHYPLCQGVVPAALKRGLPLIGTNHFLPENMIPYVPIVSRSEVLRGFLDRRLWEKVLGVFNRLDMITTPTETAATLLRQHGAQVNVRTVSCGVDLDRFSPDFGVNKAEMRARYGLDPERTVLLYVGRLSREKRIDLLIRAVHQLDRDDLQLAIAGQGMRAKALKALAEQLDLGQRVVFTGYVPAEDLPALLNSIDIFAMPSDAELQSIATLEAMGTGRPVLAADAKALPELVENGVNGYLFKAGDADDAARRMAQLIDGREYWPAMGAASLTLVRPHSLGNTLRHYEDLYRLLGRAIQPIVLGQSLFER